MTIALREMWQEMHRGYLAGVRARGHEAGVSSHIGAGRGFKTFAVVSSDT